MKNSRPIVVACVACVATALHAQTPPSDTNANPSAGVTPSMRTAPAEIPADGRARGTPTTQAADSLSARDRAFFEQAGESGLAEVAWGQLAATRATDPRIKQFGEHMVEEHTKANDELKQLAASKNVTLPERPKAEQRRATQRLEDAKGDAFDKRYVAEAVIKAHKDAVQLFQDEAKNGKDAEVKGWAQKTLPTIEAHYAQGRQLASRGKEASDAQTPR